MSGRTMNIDSLREFVRNADTMERSGRITKVVGMALESCGPMSNVGDVCKVITDRGEAVDAEVVGFNGKSVLLMPYGSITGIGPGNRVIATGEEYSVPVSESLKGRILDALGRPMDGGPSIVTDTRYPVENDPPNPLERRRIKDILPIGVKSIDSLLTMGSGQRMGIFAGSGVGKSTLLGMIARRAHADINVISLVGERGREVLDFVEKDLKEEGLARSVLVIATSDQPALLRLKSAMVSTAIAEYFRDLGYNVLLMMDSLTRFAMAQREIGMAVGEPPVSRGFTPSVYAKLPRLLERTGTSKKGSITGIYTVLVEGDDLNEPISDTVRGILDGHIVLTRALANSNHYPAIDVLQSVSRLMYDIVDDDHWVNANKIRNMMMTYNDAQDLISIGAYKQGSNLKIDEAIRKKDQISQLLIQKISEECPFEDTLLRMAEVCKS